MINKLDIVGSYFPKLWEKEAENLRASHARLPREVLDTTEKAFDITFDKSLQLYSYVDAWFQAYMSIVYWVAVIGGLIWGAVSFFSSGLVIENGIFGLLTLGLFGGGLFLATIAIGTGIGVIVSAVALRKILFLTSRRLSYLHFVKKIADSKASY